MGNLTACSYFTSRNIDIPYINIPVVNPYPDRITNFVPDPHETYFAKDISFFAESVLDGTMPIPEETRMSRQSLAGLINRILAKSFVGEDTNSI